MVHYLFTESLLKKKNPVQTLWVVFLPNASRHITALAEVKKKKKRKKSAIGWSDTALQNKSKSKTV